MPYVSPRHRLDHPVVVLVGDVPHLARFRASEDTHCLRVAIRDAREEKAGISPARPEGEMTALDEHGTESPPGEVMHEAGPRNAAADDQDVGPVRERARISLFRRRPENPPHRGQFSATHNI